MNRTIRLQASTPLRVPACFRMVSASPDTALDKNPQMAQSKEWRWFVDVPSRSNFVKPSPTASARRSSLIGPSSFSAQLNNSWIAGTREKKYLSILPFHTSPLLPWNLNSSWRETRSSKARPIARAPMGPRASGRLGLAWDSKVLGSDRPAGASSCAPSCVGPPWPPCAGIRGPGGPCTSPCPGPRRRPSSQPWCWLRRVCAVLNSAINVST